MAKAFAYVRFSSKGQVDGHSLTRQITEARKYAKEHDLELDESYHDYAVSAYKGLNIRDGNLGRFIAAVESGIVPRGSFLLVENLDRISRNVITEAQQVFLRILDLGIVIVTLMDGQVLSKEKVNADGGISMMLSLMYMLRAHEESKTKSERVSKAWEKNRNTKKIITKLAPKWLIADGDKWIVDKEKVKIIERMFELYEQGNGYQKIARALNADGIPTWGNHKEDDDIIHEWQVGSVSHFLNNKALIGIYETNKIPAREGYFPAVIDRTRFNNLQRAMASKNFTGDRSNLTTGVSNLFSGRAYCGICGARMKTAVTSRKTGERYYYLHCNTAYSNPKNCQAKPVNYKVVEKQFLMWLSERNKSVFNTPSKVEVDLRPAMQDDIAMLEAQIEKVVDLMLSSPKSEALIKRHQKMEVDLQNLRDTLAKTLPPDETDEIETGEWVWDTFWIYEYIEDMVKTRRHLYGPLEFHEQHIAQEPKSERADKHLELHKRMVGLIGDMPSSLNDEDLVIIKAKMIELRREMQMGIRRIVDAIHFNDRASIVGRPKDGSISTFPKKDATYDSYKVVLKKSGTFQFWYERPPKKTFGYAR